MLLMEQHSMRIMEATCFSRLCCEICWDPWADLSHFETLSMHMRVEFPAVRVAEVEPGSFVFGLSGCRVALGARAMLCDLSHLTDLPVAMAHE